jgi:uncharacterized repeat protein (TIGR01451 family)
VALPIPLVDCNGTGLNLLVTVATPAVYLPMPRYVNVWFDWNADGDWADIVFCPGGLGVAEWAVRNQAYALYPGSFLLTPQFLPVIRVVRDMPYETWMRVSIAEMPAPAPEDGRGPAGGYDVGETEDYYLTLWPTLSKWADLPGDPNPGDQVTFHIQYSSVGNVIAANATISDVLPVGLNFVSCSLGCSYDPGTRTVSWGVALVPGQPPIILDLVAQYTGSPSAVTNVANLMWGGSVWRSAHFSIGPMKRVYLPIVMRNR